MKCSTIITATALLLSFTQHLRSEETDKKITVRIAAGSGKAVEPLLLGLNCSWPEGQYGKSGYDTPNAQKLIRSFKPSFLRFPHGVWANFYDWESDGRRITDSYKTSYDDAVKNHPELKYGFEGFHALHESLGFETLFTWNVNYDSPAKGVRRLIDHRKKGFAVNRIELGNEIFWKTQRSEAVSDETKYIAVSKAHAAALKEVDPEIKVSVPAHWREAATNPWNLTLAKENYYDAITIHKYIALEETDEMGVAGQQMLEMAKTLSGTFPGKPIWLSEWAVSSKDETSAILAMADCWLTLIENPDYFALTNYFQMNAAEALIKYDKKTGTHTVTGYGAAYEILRMVLEGAKLLPCEQARTKNPSIRTVAISKDGKTNLIAINGTKSEIVLSVETDSKIEYTSANHRALVVNDHLSFPLGGEVLREISAGKAMDILLPPLSINVIELTE